MCSFEIVLIDNNVIKVTASMMYFNEKCGEILFIDDLRLVIANFNMNNILYVIDNEKVWKVIKD